jgi:hypothetical protein
VPEDSWTRKEKDNSGFGRGSEGVLGGGGRVVEGSSLFSGVLELSGQAELPTPKKISPIMYIM